MCGVCSSRCPAGISHPQVAMLARRINGKYLAPKTGHLEDRVKEINNGDFKELIEGLMNKPIEEIKELYNTREIEK
jgi:Fe-S oxidoreductase